MGAKNGRQKGNNAELQVAHLIEAWWHQIEPGKAFRRSPSSGGWATPEVRADFKASGDLVTKAEKFPFSVEVKRREGWNLANVLAGRRSPIWRWWAQTNKAAKEMNAHPMLWFRQNREPWRIVFSEASLMQFPVWDIPHWDISDMAEHHGFFSPIENPSGERVRVMSAEFVLQIHPEKFVL